MAHSRYLREMARSLRVEQRLTVDELAARLSLPRSTIYYWVRDLPLRGGGRERARHEAPAPRAPAGARARAEAAYAEGLASFEELSAQPTFRDFVCIYVVQGEQRDRTRVALTNADPAVMRLVSRWMRRLTDKALTLSLQCAPDQSPGELRRFWGETTGAEPRAIRVRGPAEGGSAGCPTARGAPHGVLTATVDDTLLRARLQGWIQRTRETWL